MVRAPARQAGGRGFESRSHRGRPVAQLVARRHDKPEVARSSRAGTTLALVAQRTGSLATNQRGAGSSPAEGANGLLAQLAERLVHTEEAAGSSPARSTEDEAEGSKRRAVNPVQAGFESRRPPHGELSRWCAQRPVKPSPRALVVRFHSRRLMPSWRSWIARLLPKQEVARSSRAEGAKVVCPSGQGSACKAEHAGSSPAAASRWPVAQRIEQRFPKPHCAGSSPAGPATRHFPL